MMDGTYFKKYILLKEYHKSCGYRGVPEGYVRISGVGKQAKLFIRAQHMKFNGVKFHFVAGICRNGKVDKYEAGETISKSPILSIEKEITISHEIYNASSINLFYIMIEDNKANKYIPLIGADKEVNLKKYIPILFNEKLPVQSNESRDLELKTQMENKGQDQNCQEEKTYDKFVESKEATKLQKLFNDSFPKCQPFSIKRIDYIWYEVGDISLLSNILYSNGIQIPIFANPKILIGLFKFGHLIAGIYTGQNNYFVLGVPAIKGYDEEPFEKLCRWASIPKDNKRKYDGYWLIYMDMKTGQFLK